MSTYLRRVRKAKWHRNNNVDWLPVGELQADALGDLRTEDNKLSIWQLEGEGQNISDIIAAIASKSEHLSIVDYALLESKDINERGIEATQSEGDTPNDGLNRNNHLDLIQLTLTKLVGVSEALRSKSAFGRALRKDVENMIVDGIIAGAIDPNKIKLKDKYLRKINEQVNHHRAANP